MVGITFGLKHCGKLLNRSKNIKNCSLAVLWKMKGKIAIDIVLYYFSGLLIQLFPSQEENKRSDKKKSKQNSQTNQYRYQRVPLKVGKIRQRISCRLAFNSQFCKQFDSALTCFGTCQGIGDYVFRNALFQKRRSNSFIMCKIAASDSITLIYDKQTART